MAQNLQSAVSSAVEAGASVEDINTLAKEEVIKPKAARIIEADVPVGEDLTADLDSYVNPYASSEEEYSNEYDVQLPPVNKNASIASAQIYASTAGITGVDAELMLKKADAGMTVNVFEDQLSAITMAVKAHGAALTDKLRKDPANAESLKAEAGKAVRAEVEALNDEVLGQYLAIINQDPEAQKRDLTARKEAAVSMYLWQKVSEIADKAGIGDWAGVMLLPDYSFNSAQLLKSSTDASFAQRYVQSPDFLYEFSNKYALLPAEQKISVINDIIAQLPDATSNELKQIELLMNATGQQSLEELKKAAWWDKFDAVTATIGGAATVGKRLAKVSKAFNPVKAMTRAGNKDIAGVAIDEVLRNPDKVRLFGMNADDAAIAADPRQTKELLDLLNGAPEGVSTEVKNMLDTIDELNKEASNILEQGLGLRREEQLNIQRSYIENIKEVGNVKDVSVVSETADGFSIKFTTTNGKGEVLQDAIDVPYTVDDVGTFIDKEMKGILPNALTGAASPNILAGADKDLLLTGYEIADFSSRKIGSYLKDQFNIATKGLNKASVTKLNYILEHGAKNEVIYSYDELVNAGIGGVRMTPKEYASYVGTRKVIDNLWFAKNAQIRKDLLAQGVKDIVGPGDIIYKAKPYATLESANAAYNNLDGTSVFIKTPLLKEHKAGFARTLLPEQLKAYYEQGYKLVRASNNVDQMFPSEAVGLSKWALIPAEDIRPISPVVMRKRIGYIPRSYKAANYFVKEQRFDMIDGVTQPAGARTLRYFDNIDDAEKFKDQLRAEALDAGQPFDETRISIIGDREMTSAELNTEIVGQWGGLYSGARGEEHLRFGLAGTEGATVDAIEAIQDYMRHVSNRYPMSTYRLGLEQRWLNTARETVPEMKGFKGSFSDARSIIENSIVGNVGLKNKLITSHKQIDFMNKVPTLGEQNFQGQIKKIAESMSRTAAGKKLAPYVSNLAKSDPVAALKTGAFHMYLGLYNFSQFFVQSMGSTIALSASPVHAASGLPKLPLLATLDNIKDLAARRAAMKRMAKFVGDDFEEAYLAWQKSGLRESALITNADAYTVHKGLPVSAGMMSKVIDNGTYFFSSGELANLRISFLTSYQKWKSLNKGKKVDDLALNSILAETEKFRLHMTTANKASFQKGIMSLPTQFLQINARFIEALVGKEFTKREKVSLVLGQLGLFGAAGVPFAKYAMPPVLETFGVKVEDLTAEQAIALQRGMLGWFFNDYLDIDAVFSSRVAIGEGLVDTFVDLIAGEASLPDLLLGPVGGVIDRATQGISDAFFAKEMVVTSDDLTVEQLGLVSSNIAAMLANVPSSTRNMMLAYYLSQSPVYQDKAGNFILNNHDINKQTIVLQALGFGSQDVSDFWKITIGNKKKEEAKAEAVNMVMRAYSRMFFASVGDSPEQQEAYKLILAATYSMFPEPQDHADILRSVHQKISNGQDRMSVEIRKHLESVGSEWTSSANEMIPLIKKILEERNGAAK